MRMNIMYGILVFFLFVSIPVYAQDQPSGEGHQPPSAADTVTLMQSKLNLTQDQVAAVEPIIEKYSSKRDELRQSMEDGTADRDSIRSQMKELKKDEGQELSQVLSADQLGQWEQMMSQGRHQHKSDGDGQGPSGSGSGNAEGSGNGGGGII